MEPDTWTINGIALGVPFLAYFAGIIIRKLALPSAKSPPLWQQLLLGIPLALVIVSPLLAVLRKTVTADIPTFLVTVGVIIEHGMLVNETAVKHLKQLAQGR